MFLPEIMTDSTTYLNHYESEDEDSPCAILSDTEEGTHAGCTLPGVHFVRIPASKVEMPANLDSVLSYSLDHCPSDLYDESAHMSQKVEEEILLEELDRGNDPGLLQSLVNDWQALGTLLTDKPEDHLDEQLVFGTVTIDVF